MLRKHIFPTVLFSSFLSVVSSNIPICLTWRQQNNYLQFVCHVDDLHLSVTLTDPANDELAWCLIPLPHGECLSLVPWVNVTQNLVTNETVFSVQNKDSLYINGNWTCQHGYHGDEALIEVNILDTERDQKLTVLTLFVWSFAGVGMTFFIIEIGSLFWKYKVFQQRRNRSHYSKRISLSDTCCVRRLLCVSIFVFVISTTSYAGIITVFAMIHYEDNDLGRGLLVLLGIVYAILVFISSQYMSYGHRKIKERDAFTYVLSSERRRKSRELEPDTILLSYHKDPKMKHKVSELETIPLREDPKMTHRMSELETIPLPYREDPKMTHRVSGPPGDLDEGKKRWLTVGICLNSIISPLLRKYVDPIVSNLYSSLVASDSIHTQGYHRYLKNYPGTNRYFLNYESINNNRSVPKKKINSKWINDYQKYDYKVTSHVDLSKLFLQPSMAHYSAIDVSCDLSALLGMVININSFQTVVQSDAEKIRSDIRNPWVHCDFTEWTATKYTESFQLMVQLVKDLKLYNREENMILGELNTWATNGQNFLSGTVLGLEIVNEIHQQTHILREYVLTLCTEADSQVLKVQQELNDLENFLQEIIGN